MGRMIYTKIVIDMKTGKTLEREGRWYDGEIAECKGGGSSVNNVDYEYNDRMATIAEEQQGMGERLLQDVGDAFQAVRNRAGADQPSKFAS